MAPLVEQFSYSGVEVLFSFRVTLSRPRATAAAISILSTK